MSWAEVKMAVKSIQRGYTTVTNSDVTITLGKPVDPSRCIVLLDGFCGMLATNSTNHETKYCGVARSVNYDMSISDSSWYSNISTFTIPYAYGYAVARKPYVKALTETQLTIGQSGTYSTGNNGTTVSYQVIEFFN